MSFTADEIWVSDYFKDEMAKIAADDNGAVANVQAETIKLVTDVGASQDSIDDGIKSGAFNLEFDGGNTGRAKLQNDLVFDVDGETVGGWVVTNGSSEDLFGANFSVQEVYAGSGQFILEKDDTYIDFSKGT